MKFKLNEKYTLNEKLKLAERFILIEADKATQLALQQAFTKIESKYKDVAKIAKQLLSPKLSDLLKDSTNASKLATDLKTKITATKNKIKDVPATYTVADGTETANKFKSVTTKAEPAYTLDDNTNSTNYKISDSSTVNRTTFNDTSAINAAIIENELKKESTNFVKAAKNFITNLTEYVKNTGATSNKISDLLQQLADIDKSLDNNVPTIDEWIATIDNFLNLVNSVTKGDSPINLSKLNSLKIDELSENYSRIQKVVLTIKNSDKNYLKTIKNQELEPIINKLNLEAAKIDNKTALSTNVIDYITQSIEALDKIADELELLILNRSTKQQNNKINWEEQFKLADSTEAAAAIWEDYFTKEWGKDADNIKRINAGTNAFTQECLALGFYEDSNPFIYFLKHNKKLLDILTPYSYGSLHNAYINKAISKADLMGQGELGQYNIIFSQDLYTKSNAEFPQYLNLQYSASKQFQKGNFVSKVVANRYTDKLQNFIVDLFFNPGNIFASDKQPGNFKDKLYSISEIEQKIAKSFGIASDNALKDPINNDTIDKIITALNNNKADIINAILYLYISKAGQNAAKIKSVLDKYPEIAQASKNMLDADNIIKFTTLFNNYNINAADVQNIIEKLAAAAGLSTN